MNSGHGTSKQLESLLYGQALVWVTFDSKRVVSGAMRTLLEERLQASAQRLEVHLAETLEETVQLVEQHRAGLVSLVLNGSEAEAEVHRCLRRCELRRPTCVRCVYLACGEPALPEFDQSRLYETGAQIVLRDIPWMSSAVDRILLAAPRRTGGNHPITVGLVDRLPWS